MNSQHLCPDCQSLLEPSDATGRLCCPQCGIEFEQAIQAVKKPASGSSALDGLDSIPNRPRGAMTMLRSNLRNDETTRSNWLDGLVPRRPKSPLNPESEGTKTPSRSSVRPQAPETTEYNQGDGDEPSNTAQPSAPSRNLVSRAKPSSAIPLKVLASRNTTILIALTVVSFLAVSSVALLDGRAAWANAVFLMTVALLGISILGLLHHRGVRGAFWQGFALFGCGYLILAFGPSLPHPTNVGLPTSQILREAHAMTHGAAVSPPDTGRPAVEADLPSHSKRSLAAVDLNQFLVVGHCSFAILAALFGSVIACWFCQAPRTA